MFLIPLNQRNYQILVIVLFILAILFNIKNYKKIENNEAFKLQSTHQEMLVDYISNSPDHYNGIELISFFRHQFSGKEIYISKDIFQQFQLAYHRMVGLANINISFYDNHHQINMPNFKRWSEYMEFSQKINNVRIFVDRVGINDNNQLCVYQKEPDLLCIGKFVHSPCQGVVNE